MGKPTITEIGKKQRGKQLLVEEKTNIKINNNVEKLRKRGKIRLERKGRRKGGKIKLERKYRYRAKAYNFGKN